MLTKPQKPSLIICFMKKVHAGFMRIPKTIIFPARGFVKKLGMRREGMFLEFVSSVNDENGKPIYENTMQYAILKKEWTGMRS